MKLKDRFRAFLLGIIQEAVHEEIHRQWRTDLATALRHQLGLIDEHVQRTTLRILNEHKNKFSDGGDISRKLTEALRTLDTIKEIDRDPKVKPEKQYADILKELGRIAYAVNCENSKIAAMDEYIKDRLSLFVEGWAKKTGDMDQSLSRKVGALTARISLLEKETRQKNKGK